MKSLFLAILISFSVNAFANKRITLERRLTNDFENCVIGLAIQDAEARGEAFVKYIKIARERNNVKTAILTYSTKNTQTEKKTTYEVLVHSRDPQGWMLFTTYDMLPGFISMAGIELNGSVRVQKSQELTELDFTSCI